MPSHRYHHERALREHCQGRPLCVQHRYPSGFPRDFTPTTKMLTWAREHAPDIDHGAEIGRFVAYWSIKRVRRPEERDWHELWRSWMTVAQDEALRLAEIPRNSGIGAAMIQQAQRIASSPPATATLSETTR